MLRLFALLLLSASPTLAKEKPAPSNPTWEVRVIRADTPGKSYEIGDEKFQIPLEVSYGWSCEVPPDPAGDKTRRAVGCLRGEAEVVLPLICQKNLNQVAIMNLGEKGDTFGIMLHCKFSKSAKAKK